LQLFVGVVCAVIHMKTYKVTTAVHATYRSSYRVLVFQMPMSFVLTSPTE